MPMAAIGFPAIPTSPTPSMKSREQLSSVPPSRFMAEFLNLCKYFSGEGRELRACVGKVTVSGVGMLFNERRIEILGVQNIIQNGSSGGPLISSDDPNAFIGIGTTPP